MTPPYYDLDAMVSMIDEPNRTACQRVLADHRELFQQAAGSSFNHQAWTGGYWDHVTEAMNMWMLLYDVFNSTCRLARLEPEERFSRSDGLLVLFWHDIEKPWRFELQDGKVVANEDGRLRTLPGLAGKSARKQFTNEKMQEYGVKLTPALRNGLDYVEGIRDHDYSPFDRRMKPLAALCHACDMLSARAFYNFPLVSGDGWGARRIVKE